MCTVECAFWYLLEPGISWNVCNLFHVDFVFASYASRILLDFSKNPYGTVGLGLRLE